MRELHQPNGEFSNLFSPYLRSGRHHKARRDGRYPHRRCICQYPDRRGHAAVQDAAQVLEPANRPLLHRGRRAG